MVKDTCKTKSTNKDILIYTDLEIMLLLLRVVHYGRLRGKSLRGYNYMSMAVL